MIILISKQEVAIYTPLHSLKGRVCFTASLNPIHSWEGRRHKVFSLPVKPCGAPPPKQKCPLPVVTPSAYFYFPTTWRLLLIQPLYYYHSLRSCFERSLCSFILCQKQYVVPLPSHAEESKKSLWSLFFHAASTVLTIKELYFKKEKKGQKTCIVIHSSNMLGF